MQEITKKLPFPIDENDHSNVSVNKTGLGSSVALSMCIPLLIIIPCTLVFHTHYTSQLYFSMEAFSFS